MRFSVLFLCGLAFMLTGCFGFRSRKDENSLLKFGKDVEDVKTYWKDNKGHHFVGIAENQANLEAGRRLAQILSHRAVSEKIGSVLRAETSSRLDTAGMGAESADRNFSDVISQISQNLLSGLTPEKSWHQIAVTPEKKNIYRCYHQVLLTDDDFQTSVARATELYLAERGRENVKDRALMEERKIELEVKRAKIQNDRRRMELEAMQNTEENGRDNTDWSSGGTSW